MTEAFVYWLHLPEHTNILTEGYIGVTRDPEKRLVQHRKSTDNRHLRFAFAKYKNIVHTILLKNDETYCYEMEAKLRPSEAIGWNISPGGAKPPDATGKNWTLHHKRKGRVGFVHSWETRRKISKGVQGKGMTGKIHSEETKKNLSISKQGERHPFFGMKWFHSPITNEAGRYYPDSQPIGWVKGRK